MSFTLATVLRTGGWCDITDVVRLAEQVATHCGEHRFVCLTDVERIPGVEHNTMESLLGREDSHTFVFERCAP